MKIWRSSLPMLSRARFVACCRAVGGSMLAAIVLLFVAALLTPLPAPLAEARLGRGATGSIRFVDRNGEVLREVRTEDDASRAVWVPLVDVGETVRHAMLAAEDARFYEHTGVDPAAVVRAVATSARARRVVSGASTITMQLARTVSPHPRTFRGKLGEMATAVRIEMALGKDEILEHYLNRVAFADGVRGIGAASRYFFDKPPRELSVAEAATLAGLPRGPHYYSLTKRPGAALARRDRVLSRMRERGAIDEDTYRRALAEPLTLQVDKGGFGAPHFVDALLSGALDPAVPAVRGRAGAVQTTIDRALQRELELGAYGVLRPLADRHVTAASVVVLDNATGEVLGYVGSPRWGDDLHGGKNDGVRALRQPGSTLKPFVYARGMDDLGWTPATLLPDVELHLETPGGLYTPRNYDERFHGPVRLREALGNSYNVPAVFAANELGVPRVLATLREVGLTTLGETAEFYGPALALGDGEVRLVDLANAYAAIARGGVWRPVRPVRDDSVRWLPERRVMSEATAAMIADVLLDKSARVASFGEHTALELPFAVAAKTGTSKGYRDNWTVGFTKDVTVGVWVGNFDGSPMSGVSGITGAAPLFRVAIAAAQRAFDERRTRADGPDPRAEAPATLERATACALSGGAPGPGCKHVVHEWVPKGHPPLTPCRLHETVRVDVRNGLLATPACPSAYVAERTFERFDGELSSWAEGARRERAPQVHSPLCGGGVRPHGGSAGTGLAIRYPRDGARFVVDPARSRASQAIPLKIDAPSSAAVDVFVDGRLLGRSTGGSSVFWTLAPGPHEIVAMAGDTRSEPVTIRVE